MTMDSQKIMHPFTPIEAYEGDNTCTVAVWGRQYQVAGTCLPSSVISQGQELLAGPMRIVATENGKDITFQNAQCFLMDRVTQEDAGFCCTAENENFLVNTTCKAEYDGYMDWTLSVMPMGYPISSTLAETPAPRPYSLSRLWLEIPLRPEMVPYYSFFPEGGFQSVYREDGQEVSADTFYTKGMVRGHLELPFCPQVFLSGEKSGIAFQWESAQHWEYDGYAVEVIPGEKETVLRFRLLDHEPEKWKNIPEDQRGGLQPLTFRFHMIATPVKPLPANPYAEHGLHIDCAHKVLTDYEDYLFEEFVDTGEHTGLPAPGAGIHTGEMTFDRIERLGVKVLYLHEKWNTLQNCPFITRKSAKRLKKIVAEAHRRGIKVIPYFGYEISTLAPYWAERFIIKDWDPKEPNSVIQPGWYRQPPQRDLRVCYNVPEISKLFVEGICGLIEEFRFDGVYLDGTVFPGGCKNEEHGCGWRDDAGVLHPTYPYAAVREMMRQLYHVLDPMGCTINCHTGMEYNLIAAPFYHSLWDGEAVQHYFLRGLIHELPDERMRGSYNFRSVGLPYYMLCYTNAPKWTFRNGLSISLLYGLMPRPNNAGTPLEDMAQLWKIMDKIPMERAVWHPFYEDGGIAVSNDKIKASYFAYEDIAGRTCRLVFCANSCDTPSEAELSLGARASVCLQLFGKQMQRTENGFKVCFDGFDCAVFYAEVLETE